MNQNRGSRSARSPRSPRKSQELMFANLEGDVIVEMCNKMETKELQKFVTTSQRNYLLCTEILKDRIRTEDLKLKLLIKNKILKKLETMPKDAVLNFYTFKYHYSNGEVPKTDAGVKLVKVPGYKILVDPKQLKYIVDVLKTEDYML